MDLTELAYCLLEQNEEHAYLGIEQMYNSIEELGKQAHINRSRQQEIDYIVGEIKTHLEFLAMQLKTTGQINTGRKVVPYLKLSR
jgi:hypothetical protein